VKQDYGEAMRWFRKAADQGDALAQNNIGWMYAKGQGVPRDLSEARAWIQRAAAGGYEDAKQWLAAH
jgi:TPR repeat protein